jgi:hypothetical protein
LRVRAAKYARVFGAVSVTESVTVGLAAVDPPATPTPRIPTTLPPMV